MEQCDASSSSTLQTIAEWVQGLIAACPHAYRSCLQELLQNIEGCFGITDEVARTKALLGCLEVLSPTTLNLLGAGHHARVAVPSAAGKRIKIHTGDVVLELVHRVSLVHALALRPRTWQPLVPPSYVWVSDNHSGHADDFAWMVHHRVSPLKCATTTQALQQARQLDGSVLFITNASRKEDGVHNTLKIFLEAVRNDLAYANSPVMVLGSLSDSPLLHLSLQARDPLLLWTNDTSLLKLWMDPGPPLYDTERYLVENIDAQLSLGGKRHTCVLVLTNCRLMFLSHKRTAMGADLLWTTLLELPLALICRIEEMVATASVEQNLQLHLRDCRSYQFTLARRNSRLVKLIDANSVDASIAQVVSLWPEGEPYSVSWKLYSPSLDYDRIKGGGGFERFVQKNFSSCASYPAMLLVPYSLGPNEINSLRKMHTNGAFPVVAWRNSISGGILMRAGSTVLSGGAIEIDNSDRAGSALSKSLGNRAVLVVEACKPLGRSGPAGTHVLLSERYTDGAHRVHFDLLSAAEIGSILRRVTHEQKLLSREERINALQLTGYLELLSRILQSASDGAAVVVQCETGEDVTAMLTSLSSMLLDPHYRTMQGFALLVERHWLQHRSTVGWKTKKSKGDKGRDTKVPSEGKLAAPFIVFIDCVWQMLSHFPRNFEFNEEMLLFLLDNLYSSRFGTFLCSSDKKRIKHKVERTQTIWRYESIR